MNRVYRYCSLMALCLLASCESTPNHLLTYAAEGTEIQADRLVGQLLGKDVWPLPYRGQYDAVNISEPLERMKTRFPQLKLRLDDGVIGLADDGTLAIRSDGDIAPELVQLVGDENRDREIFYDGMCSAVGHGGEQRLIWLRYVRTTFGAVWQKQARAGWWLRNEQGEWFVKS